MPYLVGIYVLILVIVAVDIGVSDGKMVRGVPKIVWLLGSMALPLLGPIAWLALGRPASEQPAGEPSDTTSAPPSRRVGTPPFTKQVRDRAEDQRRVAREQREAEG